MKTAEEMLLKYGYDLPYLGQDIIGIMNCMEEYASQFRNELDEVKDERETMIRAFCEIREEFENRTWLMEGRGSYPFNDDRYKQEVRCIMDAFNDIEKKMWKQIKSKTHEYRNEIQREFRHEVTDEEIEAESDKYGFRVPYDGSNNFYDKLAIKGFIAGAKWMREKMK